MRGDPKNYTYFLLTSPEQILLLQFLLRLGKFPFWGDVGCRHFQKMLSAQLLQSCRRKGGDRGSVVEAQAFLVKQSKHIVAVSAVRQL